MELSLLLDAVQSSDIEEDVADRVFDFKLSVKKRSEGDVC